MHLILNYSHRKKTGSFAGLIRILISIKWLLINRNPFGVFHLNLLSSIYSCEAHIVVFEFLLSFQGYGLVIRLQSVNKT